MKKVITRLQTLGQKAAEVKQAIDAAPAKAAQIRQAVTDTAGRLKQLRSELEGTLDALRTTDDASFAALLAELDGSQALLERAGYALEGVDLEQGAAPRLIVHVRPTAPARTAPLETLLVEAGERGVSRVLMEALIRAENLDDDPPVKGLTFAGLTVYLGAAPAVRILWRSAASAQEASIGRPAAPSEPQPSAPPPASAFASFAGSPFFESTARPASVAPQPEPASVTPTPPQTAPETQRTPPTAEKRTPDSQQGDWRTDALARFKKMPDLSRLRR
jgi:hypothetical protein